MGDAPKQPRLAARFCGLLLLSCVGPAAAQTTHRPSDEDACRPDVFRLCMARIPDEDAIVACLDGAVARLSPACRAVIAPERAPAASPVRRKPLGTGP